MSLSTLNSQLSTPCAKRTVHTFNAFHLGDNLIHLHFLRALAKAHPDIAFEHGAPDEHLAQLYPLWQDLPNLRVASIATTPYGAHNAWRGADGWWYHRPNRNDFAAVHLDWFRVLAERMGLASPFAKPEDLLFDYPALQDKPIADDPLPASLDFLIVNSPPRSGQWQGYNADAFDHLCEELLIDVDRRLMVTFENGHDNYDSTQERNMDVTAIGRLSQRVKCIIGCVTGPMWPTLNVWNSARPLRIHLLDAERVELCANTVHANSLTLVPEILRERGLI